ncbi:DUF4189 domain-containing protein [Stenotrophomonas muris]|uniref:DUF4189 domain-containing protein n=1 Tax=Stenotrophomonas muris TaxID=2963283 RepID=UPI001072B930|nr:DUF4189 domain-containing protein [Stenotrophomonas maltophilia]
MKLVFFSILFMIFIPAQVMAEGRCPPGQYPIGDERHGVAGCAPIPGGQGAAAVPAPAPVPTGEWETRWGAIAQDYARREGENLALGVSKSQKTKDDASSVAIDECRRVGGHDCRVVFSYKNQCAALSMPEAAEMKRSGGTLVAAGDPEEGVARRDSLRSCQSRSIGGKCNVVYSACSMSEFRSFR